MSFLSCIGHVMQDARLTEVFEQIYACNTVKHMSGKAVSHAMRGHDLFNQALNILFTAASYDIETDELLHVENYPSDFKQVGDLFRGFLLDNTHNIEDTEDNQTAAILFQYMEMVTILKCFIRAERTENWLQYLKTLNDTLLYCAAAGHTHYTKINVTDSGAGLASDLIIEQVLMRSLKTTGSLTRGRGTTDTQRSIWLLSMPTCTQINECMQDLTGLIYSTSEQQSKASQSRIQRDYLDTQTIISFLTPLEPFNVALEQHNIVTGMTVSTGANVDSAKEVRLRIINNMTGKATDTPFGRKIKLAWQIVASRECPDMKEIMSHGLCTHPPSLFKSYQVFRKANKPPLATAIWEIAKPEAALQCIPSHSIYKIDGVWLIQQIPWQLGTTYDTICDTYVEYGIKNFGKVSIVFVRYSNRPSMKDITHLQRTNGRQCPVIEFSGAMKRTQKKDIFLLNSGNKERIIAYIGKNSLQQDVPYHMH
ncbi:hypothetical protein PR048_008144 [Dryococelus australis]|uniref:Uncharacterized protein n=1 Tax=Dryococelus australis TaxID=614101 RepID=A0ABQ9HWK9_9NEOP|nr:hypothetical protein PR048_008144 [Dryococelus australis]